MKTEFTYNGLLVKRDYFSHAGFPINCDNISDSQMQAIVVILYAILHNEYHYSNEELKGDGDSFNNEDLLFAYNVELEGLLINNGAEYI